MEVCCTLRGVGKSVPGLCPLGAKPAIPGGGTGLHTGSPARAGAGKNRWDSFCAHLRFVSILLPTVLKRGCDSGAAPSRRRSRGPEG